MKFIEWTKDMSVGSDEMDGHHQVLIDCLNDLHPLLTSGADTSQIQAVLAKLEDFVLVHFSCEEMMMKKVGYPDWRQHKELHDKMYDLVFSLKSDVEHGRQLDAQRLFDLLNKWLIEHILGEDKKYGPFLDHPQTEGEAVWHRANGRPY